MAGRPKHQRKELEKVLRDVEERGWTVTKNAAYFKIKCPCGLHLKWVALTPSGNDYEKNLRKWLERQACWRGTE